MHTFSVIIPSFNEELHICKVLGFFSTENLPDVEIILANGGSSDHTLKLASQFSCVQIIKCSEKGRAVQMNEAARLAKGSILYFVHSDVIPPSTWKEDILREVHKRGKIGGFRFKFDSRRPLLKFNSWMTRWNILAFRGGDQTIFILKDLFQKINGYPKWEIMEEYELINRAKRNGDKYHLIQKDVTVSSRKYKNNSYFKINLANGLAMLKYRLGVDHKKIKKSYSKMIRQKNE